MRVWLNFVIITSVILANMKSNCEQSVHGTAYVHILLLLYAFLKAVVLIIINTGGHSDTS